MAIRLVRPLYARIGKGEKNPPPGASSTVVGTPLDRREPSLSPPPTSHHGSIKVQRDVAGFEGRREPSISLLPTSDTDSFQFQHDSNPVADDSPIKVVRDGNAGTDEYAHGPRPPRTEPADDVSIVVLRDDQAIAEDRSEPSLSPPPMSSEDAAAEVRRNAKLIIEEIEREPQLAPGLSHNRRNRNDERLSSGTLIRIAAALIVLGLGFTALLPSLLTRDPVDPATTFATARPTALAQPAQTDEVRAVQPIPAPTLSPSPPAVQPAPAPDDVASVAKTPPTLRGSSAFEKQDEGRAPEDVLVPSTGKAAGRTPLTAAEKAAVARGLQELEKRADVATPRRPAPTGPRLTAEEKAAVERGLRELEKTPGQPSP